MGIADRIKIEKNQPRSRIIELFSQAKAALHTMRYEHFGIAVVELMASGIITVAHRSAGPLKDIIGASKKPVGYLARTVDEYAYFLRTSLRTFDSEEHLSMRKEARAWVSQRFSPMAFELNFNDQLSKLV